MFLEVDMNPMFDNDDVEDGNDNSYVGNEIDISVKVDSTYNFCANSFSLFCSKIYMCFLSKLLELTF